MPSREEIAYFGAGPAPLPTKVLEEGAVAFVNFENTGISLAELSHRSPTANRILAEAKASLIKLLDIPEDYEVLFCHGGGTGGFASVVFNLVAVWVERRRQRAEKETGDAERVRREIREELKIDYLVTGSWSLKASQEAANLLEPIGKGLVNVAVDARKANDGKFGRIPDENSWNLSPKDHSAFVYYCDNETVDGVEFPALPSVLEQDADERLIVADMSSNFLSRKVDVSKYAVIFGGAQKNIGITDITLIILRKSILAEQPSTSFLHSLGVWSPPAIMHWPTLAKNSSLYNTLPIFSVHVASLVLTQLLAKHGPLAAGSQAAESGEKAELVYGLLDAHPDVFTVCAEKSVRSRMNICFRIAGGDAVEKRFLEGAERRGLLGLKGHRSVGGIRVSNYNAVPVENVRKLRSWMESFLQEVGK